MTKQQRLCLILLVLIAMIIPFTARATEAESSLAGTWVGTLEIPGNELEMVFHITLGEDGSWLGTLDVPAQGAVGLPISQVGCVDGEIVFNVALIAGVFSGSLDSEGESIEGLWTQSGMDIPLTLKRTLAEQTRPKRPQEPKPPYPYSEIEVLYPNQEAGIELAGTLTLPQGEGPFPVVILISGSGPQDRNEELMGHKPFLVLADYLTKRGIAVLRVDDRGVGESTGDFNAATTLDFTRDVLAGVDYLKTRPEIDPERIGLIGHSEGGLIAPLAASISSDVAFIVLMAGPALNGEEISKLQSDLMLRVSGAPEEVISQQKDLLEELIAIAKDFESVDQAVEDMRNVMLAPYAELSEEELASLGDLETPIMMQISQLLSPWYQFFMTYDPLPALRKVTCPVLAINGSKDLQVPADPNLPLIEEALREGGNENFTVLELPDLNHLFQTAVTGHPDEYYLIEETISPVALEVIGNWLVEVAGIK